MRDDELDIAWAAGLFEGEGCAAIAKNGTRSVARMYINMTDEDVMRRFHTIVGVGALYEPTEYSIQAKRKPMWRWACGKRADIAYLIERFSPYMCSRRLAKFEELKAYI